MVETSKIRMAVNDAVNQYSNRLRNWLQNFRDGGSLDSKRPRAWCEYGFPDQLTFTDFYLAYKRHGISFGAVEKLGNGCWSTSPWVIEGDPDEEPDTETEWETSVGDLLRPRIWAQFKQADKFRLAARYSGLILHFADSRNLKEEVKPGSKLVKITPVWQSALTPNKYNEDRNNVDYGKPIAWTYKEADRNAAAGSIEINADRVFILGDWRPDAIGFLEPVFNNVISMEKVEGGSGESFLKNAARQLSVSFDKEVDLSNLAQTYGVKVEELQKLFNDATRDLNRGVDMMLVNQGAQVSTLVTEVPDPQPTFNVNLQVFSAGVDIPSKILVGMQTGERASTEDQKYFNGRCQARRVQELSFEIEDFIRHLMRLRVIQEKPKFSVMWSDMTEATQSDKLDNASKMATINAGSMGTGEQIFEGNEIRVAAGFEPAKLKPLPDDEDVTNDEPGAEDE